MHESHSFSIVDFFDSIAPKWDSWEDMNVLNYELGKGLEKFGVNHGENILDVGCGTGNLTAALLSRLSREGKVTAVDISPRMIEIAKDKINDSRVQWICDRVECCISFKSKFDRIICYSVWPHLENPENTVQLFRAMLKPGGVLHIWHLKSRKAINKIHSEASEALSNHLLAPAGDTAELLKQAGFIIKEMQDDDSGYLITAVTA